VVAQMQRRFLFPERVSDQTRDQIDEEIVDAAMARMLNLRNVFELVIDRFTDAAFARAAACRTATSSVLSSLS
jgi:hypothetical protein